MVFFLLKLSATSAAQILSSVRTQHPTTPTSKTKRASVSELRGKVDSQVVQKESTVSLENSNVLKTAVLKDESSKGSLSELVSSKSCLVRLNSQLSWSVGLKPFYFQFGLIFQNFYVLFRRASTFAMNVMILKMINMQNFKNSKHFSHHHHVHCKELKK